LILMSIGIFLASLNYYITKDKTDWTPRSENDITTIQGTVAYFNKTHLGRNSYRYDFSLKEYSNFIFRIDQPISSVLSRDSSLTTHPIRVADVIQVGISKKDYNIKIAHTQAQDWWDYIYKYEYIATCTLALAHENRSYISLATYNKHNMEYYSPSDIGNLSVFEKLFLILGIGTVIFQCFSMIRNNRKVSVARQ
jgi:hypothetical protein